jgi:hypothetical protein
MITQADRDATGALIGSTGLSCTGYMIRQGRSDDHPLVKAFAAHRIAAERAQRDRDAVIADEHKLNTDVTDDPGVWAYTTAATDIAVAIRDQAATPLHQPTGSADVAASERN